MFDVFYFQKKPNLFPHEREITSIDEAIELSRTRFFWVVHYLCDYTDFDFLWEPRPWEAHQAHVFPSQWQWNSETVLYPKIKLEAGDSFPANYHSEPVIQRLPTTDRWSNLEEWPDFDTSWHPDPTDPEPYIYKFSTQHQKSGGPVYIDPGAKPNFVKYLIHSGVTKTSIDEHWDRTDFKDFDYTWHPDETEPPYIYKFGTQHQKTGGPTYITPGAPLDAVKYISDPRVTVTDVNESCWDDLSYDFDYTWHPDDTEPPYIYKFGTQHQKTGGPTYTVPGATEVKYVTNHHAIRHEVDDECWDIPDGIEDFDYTWHPDDTEPPYLYQFGTQWQKTGGPKYVMDNFEGIKYVSAPRAERTVIDKEHWHEGEVLLEDFDYTWHPDESEPPYNYQFGTQHQKTGGPMYAMPGATNVKYVSQERVKNITISQSVYLIDHSNPEADDVVTQLENKGVEVKKRSRFIASYKGTLERLLSREEAEFVWVCSTVCDYSDFDFSWHPEKWQGLMLHVFASDDQKFGDTFLINVPSFKRRIKEAELLEWYDTIHFVDNISVPRWMPPVVTVDGNSIVEPVKNHVFKEPLTVFTDKTVSLDGSIPAVNLWREKTRAITPLSKGNSTVIVPRDAKTHVLTELYDYPWIDTRYSEWLWDKPLDVVFISNGEKNAEKNWKHLQRCIAGKNNRLVRVDGVNGREAAYKAAANASETAWFFAVFAKLTVDKDFDWSWQPDRLQVNKHYIFHAKNPINGLEYGHMAMIAYHKELVLSTTPSGLDFTLDAEHEVAPILSGVANYADDLWTAWRSAFREVIKLQDAVNKQPDVETEFRLKQWLTVGDGELGKWSKQGALDAVNYYMSVDGDFEKLRLSYDWGWLHEYFVYQHNVEPESL